MARTSKTNNSVTYPVNLHILMGLPGCGKTTFASNWKHKTSDCIMLLDCDDVYDRVRKTWNFEYAFNDVKNSAPLWGDVPRQIMLDGLFLTNDDIVITIDSIAKIMSTYYPEKNFKYVTTIHYWIPNKEICLYNDSIRRRKLFAVDTINNTDLKRPDYAYLHLHLDTKTDFNMVDHTSKKADVFALVMRNYSCDGQILKSVAWNPAEEAPSFFDAFEEIVFTVCSNISYMMFRKIWKESNVRVVHNNGLCDYYSDSRTDYLHYEVNVNELRNILEKYNMIDPIE